MRHPISTLPFSLSIRRATTLPPFTHLVLTRACIFINFCDIAVLFRLLLFRLLLFRRLLRLLPLLLRLLLLLRRRRRRRLIVLLLLPLRLCLRLQVHHPFSVQE